jgi:hypothetical protein
MSGKIKHPVRTKNLLDLLGLRVAISSGMKGGNDDVMN